MPNMSAVVFQWADLIDIDVPKLLRCYCEDI